MTPSVWWSRSRWERPMQSPRAHHPHLHPSARGSARSHTWGVHTSCPPSPGNCQGHPGAGGPGVRDGVDWTGRGSCLEQSLNSGSLFGSCKRPGSGTDGCPHGDLLGRQQPGMAVQGGTGRHCAGKREALEKKNHQDMQHGTICFTKSLLFITAAIAPGTMLAPVLRQVLPPCASVSPSIRWG